MAKFKHPTGVGSRSGTASIDDKLLEYFEVKYVHTTLCRRDQT